MCPVCFKPRSRPSRLILLVDFTPTEPSPPRPHHLTLVKHKFIEHVWYPFDNFAMAELSNLDRANMSLPPFITLPREIRDRIYDFVWDLGQEVSLSTPLRRTRSSKPGQGRKRKSSPFENVAADTILALLHVNHQISAEAASTFYGKRIFSVDIQDLTPFIEGIGLRRHLITDINVSDVLEAKLRQTLSSLRSFTIKVNRQSLRLVQEYLIGIGVYKMTDRIDVTVHSECAMTLPYGESSGSSSVRLLESVVFTNTWKWAKGGNGWKSEGLHCRVKGSVNEKFIWVHHENASQPCDHNHHRQRQDWDIDGFPSAMN